MKKIVILALLCGSPLFALNIRLSQIDTSQLLLNQMVRLYVSVTDEQGRPVEDLEQKSFQVAESVNEENFQDVPVSEFKSRAGSSEGINFLLLIDNSGSMYDSLSGQPTESDSRRRITHAKQAVNSFLTSMTNPQDTVGLVVYNTFYNEIAPPSREKAGMSTLLAAIQKPASEAAYTELYASLTLAADAFSRLQGRKAIVVLSDGENYPYYEYSKELHPVFQDKIYAYGEPIEACQENGVSVYAIHFGSKKDRFLKEIAVQTGGTVFDAGNQQELQTVYKQIHDQVAGEYLLGYRATMAPAERKFVQVDLIDAEGTPAAARRFYFSSSVLGMPIERLSLVLLIPLVLAVVLLVLLMSLRLERPQGPASIEVLHTRVGSAPTKLMPITSNKTVIGGAASADLTIAGNPAVKQNHATIVHDPRKGSYTIVSTGDGDLRVNNQTAKTRVLEAGDVIDVGGTTIVFDDGEV